MAVVYAISNGNWSNPAIWSSGSLPDSVDDVYTNARTVTVDISTTVTSIRGTATTGVSAGGTLQIVSGGITFSFGTMVGRGAVNSYGFLLVTHTSGVVTLNGNVSLATGQSNSWGITISGSGEVVLNGNLTAGSNQGNIALYKNGLGKLTINGSVTGGQSYSFGLLLEAGEAIINGSAYGGNGAVDPFGVFTQGSPTLTINGDVYNNSITTSGYTLNCGLSVQGGVVTLNGLPIITGISTTSAPVRVVSYGQLVVNVPGGGTIPTTNASLSAPYFMMNGSNGTLTINGSVSAANMHPFFTINGSGNTINISGQCLSGSTTTTDRGLIAHISGDLNTVNFNGNVTVGAASPIARFASGSNNKIYFNSKIIGNTLGYNQTSSSQTLAIVFSAINNKVYAKEIQAGPFGAFPLNGYFYLLDPAKITLARDGQPDQQFASDEVAAGLSPPQSDVRLGVTYGLNSSYTGTCAVPSAGSVLLGVPVDNTTGTVDISGFSISVPTAEEVAEAVRVELSPELERVSNCSTVQSTGDQIAAAL